MFSNTNFHNPSFSSKSRDHFSLSIHMANATHAPYLKYILLVLYLVILIWILFFIHIPPFTRSPLRFQGIHPQLIPLENVFRFFTSDSFNGRGYFILSNIIGNIGLFMPIGIFFPWFCQSHHNGLKATLFTMLVSAVAELLQYTFYLGVFDIDDILFNTLGGWIGYLLFKWWSSKRMLRKDNV